MKKQDTGIAERLGAFWGNPFGRRKSNPRSFLTKYIRQNDRGAEIGVWKGDFSEMVLRTGRISEYFLIDPYEYMPQFPNRMYGGKVAQAQSDMDEIFEQTQHRVANFPGRKMFVRKRSLEAAKSISDATLDFVYVDGNHYYQGVYDDISTYLGKLKIGGYLMLDDWNWLDDEGNTSVKQAACDFLRRNPNCLQLAEIKANQAVFLVTDNLLV